MRLIKLTNNIYRVVFKTQRKMASTFLRFQEHYESPKFRGKVFDLDEFKKWYKKEHGEFSYYYDWVGFNLPSACFKPFRKGKFNPLTSEEQELLDLIKDLKGNFCVIGTEGKTLGSTFKHELAHALFSTDKKYKQQVKKCIKKYKLSKIKKFLRSLNYAEAVIEDETHAYLMFGFSWMKRKKVPVTDDVLLARKELLSIYYSTIKANDKLSKILK